LGHELRNPLAPVRSGLRILQSRSSSPDTAELIAMIDRQVDHMVRLIEDLLDINRVTTGGLLLKREVLVLGKVIAGAIEISAPLIDQKKHSLKVIQPEGDCLVHADPTRLAQVFGNLLNNAAKYSAEGTPIRVVVQRADGQVSVDVEDEGIGIPSEMVQRVFDIFTRVEQEGEPAQEGLGIGLSVAKRLTEMHGGSIEVHSAGRGRGSRFRVTLPLAVAETGADRASPPGLVSGGPRKVLVVDDNTDAATSMATLIGMMGHEARAVHSGLDALAMGGGFAPDIIFLDIGMPDLDGYAVARQLRETQWGNAVTLVALTGWGQPDDLTRSRDAGFDAHIVKPIDSKMLSRILDGQL
jgi:CheY-like chemotaxis protein/two-component sensor histidine kinase